ncbi:hypothetical protein VQ574_20810 (plasmid) [Stutzerimonas frequens]|uniref:hypothetical protein n=1 Tax=Stutzerimonas frequens TaxID=2968969 RepID=UPI002DBA098E|nr:hypothetical protein [Stutzerimonas frequens]WRW29381.1 hypothetical protein VQ574_20810 [Stutzerimonas frequens]
MSTDQLSVWTVYRRPKDYPEQYVARRWIAAPHPTPTEDILIADDLKTLQEKMPPGLTRMQRQQCDDPVIVETWI